MKTYVEIDELFVGYAEEDNKLYISVSDFGITTISMEQAKELSIFLSKLLDTYPEK